jgi:hypothetical protein
MKIEIELEEVERLREQIKRLETEVERHENYRKNNSEEEYRRKAEMLGKTYLDCSLSRIFKELGFESYSPIEFDGSFNRWHNSKWWEEEDLKINLGAEVTQSFARAFIKIGFNVDQLKEYRVKWEL